MNRCARLGLSVLFTAKPQAEIKIPSMAGFWHLNLIHFLDFYFSFFFLANTMRRWRQYRIIGKLVVTSPGRWPRLLNLIQENKTIVLTWTTFVPGLLALGLSILQVLASRLVWPEAGMPPHGLT